MNRTLTVMKGHGTENDFVLLPDLDAVVSMSPSMVQALCDRRAGIGADGVLRVTRTALATEPDVHAQADVAEYFMDYHNADGSIAETCGNGLRVFGRYLQQAGLVDPADGVTVATRGGPRALSFDGEHIIAEIGPATLRPERPRVSAEGLTGEYDSVALDLPNPHVVVELASVEDLAALRLTEPPRVVPGLPEGQNVEFVVRTGPGRLRMRVHERGSGETRSCGSGICAVVAALAGTAGRSAGASTGSPAGRDRWLVEVPGGQCQVWWNAAGAMMLSGPAVLVASLELSPQWLALHR